jgi:hypothetical protein
LARSLGSCDVSQPEVVWPHQSEHQLIVEVELDFVYIQGVESFDHKAMGSVRESLAIG